MYMCIYTYMYVCVCGVVIMYYMINQLGKYQDKDIVG